MFFRGAYGCVLVYDITKPESLKNLDRWKQELIDKHTTIPCDPFLFPFVVIGNKNDCEKERKVEKRAGERWCQANDNIPFYETSSKEGVTFEKAIIDISRKALKIMDKSNEAPSSNNATSGTQKLVSDSGKKSEENNKKKSLCC